MATSKRYFATETGVALSRALCARVDRYQKHVVEAGFFALWLKAYHAYYGMAKDGYTSHEIGRKGAEDEYVVLIINHFRNLITHFLTLATSQRAALEPQAATSDYQAEVETAIARGVLDFYMRQHLEQSMRDATEFSVVFGAGWVGQAWNFQKGEPLMDDYEEEQEANPEGPAGAEALGPELPVEDEEAPAAAMRPPLLTGALESHSFTPMDHFVEPRAKRADTDWEITRRYVNRWDLVAQFTEPDVQKAILDKVRTQRERELDFEEAHLQASGTTEDLDEVALYEFWHKKTPACPAGRHALFLDEETLLYAEPLPYHDIPIKRIAVANLVGTPHGYTHAWDLLGQQEAINMLASIRLTNQRAHGVGLVAVPKGSDLTPTQIAKGLNMIEYIPGLGKPELLNFTGTPPEIERNQADLVQDMETTSGVNSVVRGNPEASLKSGSALALVQAQAVQFASLFQGNLARLHEGAGEDCILIFQRYATEPVRIEVTGQDARMREESYTGADVALVRRVRVNMGNPLAHTLAGRVQLAESIAQVSANAGTPIDVGQYLRVIESGRLEPMTEAESQERSNIKAENEMLARARYLKQPNGELALEDEIDEATGMPTGKQKPVLDAEGLPSAMITDDPFLHVKQHLSVLQNPWARRNRAVVDAVLAHVSAHENMHAFATLNRPGLLELMGIPPQQAALMQQQAQMLAMQPGAGGAPQGAGPKGAPQANIAEMMPGGGPPGEKELPNLPQMPVNPANGVRAEAPGAGNQPNA